MGGVYVVYLTRWWLLELFDYSSVNVHEALGRRARGFPLNYHPSVDWHVAFAFLVIGAFDFAWYHGDAEARVVMPFLLLVLSSIFVALVELFCSMVQHVSLGQRIMQTPYPNDRFISGNATSSSNRVIDPVKRATCG